MAGGHLQREGVRELPATVIATLAEHNNFPSVKTTSDTVFTMYHHLFVHQGL